MTYAIGIDVGTALSSVAVLEEGEPRLLRNAEDRRSTPSVVGVASPPELTIGSQARSHGRIRPTKSVRDVKRLLGRDSDDPVVQRYRQLWSCSLGEDEEGRVRIEGEDRSHSPERLMAAILKELRASAERRLDGEVTDAVLSVPALFDDVQRSALHRAAELAGLEVGRLVNAPTAVALQYGRGSRARTRHAVVDLGAGGIEVSVLALREGIFEVLSTAGDSNLGAREFDQRVLQSLYDEFREAHGVSVAADPVARERLFRAAESARIELSEATRTWVDIPAVATEGGGREDLSTSLSRSAFESMVEPLVETVESRCRRAREEADLEVGDVDELTLVGGLAETPVLRRRIEAVFGRAPTRHADPATAVVRGAAQQAGMLAGQVENLVMLDVTPMDLGIRAADDTFTPIVSRNTSIPTRETLDVTTTHEGQTDVTIEVLQGIAEDATENTLLGMFTLTGLPAKPAGDVRIEVAFEVDSDGMVDISARDLETGREQSMRVEGHRGVSDETIRESRENLDEETADDEADSPLADWLDEVGEDSSEEGWLHNPSTSVSVVESMNEEISIESAEGDDGDATESGDGDESTDDEADADAETEAGDTKSWRRKYEEANRDDSGPSDEESREEKIASLRESAASRINRKIENLEPPEDDEEAQAYFNQGYRAHRNHAHSNALEYIEKAYRYDEQNTLYKTYYAYVSFLTNPRNQDRAKQLLRDAVWEEDPQVAPDAHFFLGRILKVQEHHEQAKRHFRKAVELDPKLKGAQRELRLYQKREGDDSGG